MNDELNNMFVRSIIIHTKIYLIKYILCVQTQNKKKKTSPVYPKTRMNGFIIDNCRRRIKYAQTAENAMLLSR